MPNGREKTGIQPVYMPQPNGGQIVGVSRKNRKGNKFTFIRRTAGFHL